SSTVVGWYNAARDSVYLARLIDRSDRELFREAELLEKRLEWTRAGQSYGGGDFYRFEPYSRESYITTALTELERNVVEMRRLERERATTTADMATWLGNLRENKATRDVLRGTLAATARREIRGRIV